MCVCVLAYAPSGLSVRPSHVRVLQLLLMLEVRVAQAWRGMVPITSGNDRDKFKPPGMSTYTCRQGETVSRDVSLTAQNIVSYSATSCFSHCLIRCSSNDAGLNMHQWFLEIFCSYR